MGMRCRVGRAVQGGSQLPLGCHHLEAEAATLAADAAAVNMMHADGAACRVRVNDLVVCVGGGSCIAAGAVFPWATPNGGLSRCL